MSRLIVKNLPQSITEKSLKDQFKEKGTITDIQLKYTKDGVFRQFAFIGYATEEEAQQAISFYNKSFIKTNRITVELCSALGSETKPQSWSKHSADSSAFKKINNAKTDNNNNTNDKQINEKENLLVKKKNKKGNKVQEIFEEHKSDPKFREFLEVHSKGHSIWDNDLNLSESNDRTDNNENDKTLDGTIKDTVSDEDTKMSNEKLANKSISDREYMKLLMKKSSKKKSETESKTQKISPNNLFTIKIRQIPFATKRKDVLVFFKPIKPFSIRLPTRVHGICYVGFKTEKDFAKAMLKNKSFLNGKQVLFTNFTERNKQSVIEKEETGKVFDQQKNSKWSKQEESLKNEEHISESGKIFFRNLAYTLVEDDLQKLFETYGPVADLSVPIDQETRRIKGFGTVTFVMPEHAVIAFNNLDGTIFHGRLLHLIPGKNNDEAANYDSENLNNLNFKQKQELKLKKTANSQHNWNTLFLGENAIANTIAKQFQTTKENILDSNGAGTSAAVRLALGETQIVLEMKKFLEDNDVCLSVFNVISSTVPRSNNTKLLPSIKRSNTIILAKNLPADTTVAELRPIFCKFGLLGRIVLPPSGVTALIEYLEPYEAKMAFKKLAYSKFKSLPLYLEWAPEGTFKTPPPQPPPENTISASKIPTESVNNKISLINEPNNISDEIINTEQDKTINKNNNKNFKSNHITNEEDNDNNDDDDTPPETGTTIFLRNLNFITREPTVREHFQHLGKIHIVQVAMKKDPENYKNRISLGYGFIQFKKREIAEKALKTMQFTTIEGNAVELKRSDRTLQAPVKTTRKVTKHTEQTGTKILVRNIPFQAKEHEIREIFQAFGELNTVRLPKKMTPGEESHRGFGFVDFYNKKEAKKSFDALCQSTHLYGRRLVLEWAAVNENIEDIRKRTTKHFNSATTTEAKKSKKSVFDSTNMNIDE